MIEECVQGLIGVGMAAGASFLGNFMSARNLQESRIFTTIRSLFEGISSELSGDTTERGISGFFARLQERKTYKIVCERLRRGYGGDIDKYEGTCNQILGELLHQNTETDEKNGKDHPPKENHVDFKTNDISAILKLCRDTVVRYDFKSALEQSATYKALENSAPAASKAILDIIKETTSLYFETKFDKITNSELKITTFITISSLKEYFGNRIENLEKQIATMMAYLVQNDGGIDFPKIVNGRGYIPKYVLQACPNCGYDGDRIYVNEAANTKQCAACGMTFFVPEYDQPELIKAITNVTDLLNSMRDSGEEQYQGIIAEIQKSGDACTQALRDGLEQVVTKEYLNACMDQKLGEWMQQKDTLLLDSMRTLIAQVAEMQAESDHTDILAKIGEVNEKNEKYNRYLGRQLDDIGNRIGEFYRYAREQFSGLTTDSKLLLQHVDLLCTKEFFEEKSNSLGADIEKTVSAGFEQVSSLTATGMAQIMARLDDMAARIPRAAANAPADRGAANNTDIEELIRQENSRLSGAIQSSRRLLENMSKENRASFSQIIEGQEEIKIILMSTLGLGMDQEHVRRLYRGRIPSKYLLDEGLGKAFPCPYCGAIDERRLTEEQYCRCAICGKTYYPLSPYKMPNLEKSGVEIAMEEYGRDENDEYLATREKIDAWREERKAIVDNQRHSIMPTPMSAKTRIIFFDDNCVDKVTKHFPPQGYSINCSVDTIGIYTAIISNQAQYVDKGCLRKLKYLETIVFLPCNDGKSSIQEKDIKPLLSPNVRELHVYGLTQSGEKIKIDKKKAN